MIRVVLLLLLLLLIAHVPMNAKRVLMSIANYEHMKQLAANENSDVAPCKDFYEYSCGNWRGYEPYGDTTVLEQLDRNVNRQFAQFLERTSPTEPLMELTRNYYKACRSQEKHRAWPYLQWLAEKEGIRWPGGLPGDAGYSAAWSNTSADANDWPWLLGVLRRYGFNGVLIEETVLQREDNRDEWELFIGMPSDMFLRLTPKMYARIMGFLGIGWNDIHGVLQLWPKVHRFEVQLSLLIAKEQTAKASPTDDSAADDDNNSIHDVEYDEQEHLLLSVKQRGLTWLQRYLDTALQHMDKRVGQLPTSTMNGVFYWESLTELLNKTPKEFISQYLTIRFIWHLYNAAALSTGQHDCVTSTRLMLPHAMEYMYERQQPQLAKERKQVTRIFRALKRTFQRTLAANANQFGPEELKYLQDKLVRMQLSIGNLPQRQARALLEKYYASLLANNRGAEDNYVAEQLRAMRHSVRGFHEQAIPKAVKHDKNETATGPETETVMETETKAEVDEYFYIYEPLSNIEMISSTPFFLQRANLIVLPLTLLNWPLYDRGHHDLLKFSSLGFMLAHELSHGFDYSGVVYDGHGNAASERIMSLIRGNERLSSLTECLSSRNASALLDEKIADLTGLRLAYDTYFNTLHSKTEHSPWLPNSTMHKLEQLIYCVPETIFIQNFAQFFCYTSDNDIDISAHGGNRQRVLDAVANLPYFATVFGCGSGSASALLLPKDQQRCQIQGRQQQQQKQEGQHHQEKLEYCELWS